VVDFVLAVSLGWLCWVIDYILYLSRFDISVDTHLVTFTFGHKIFSSCSFK
jgi:hypothetical protein